MVPSVASPAVVASGKNIHLRITSDPLNYDFWYSKDGEHYWGAGVDQDIIRASINALLTAINNMVNAK